MGEGEIWARGTRRTDEQPERTDVVIGLGGTANLAVLGGNLPPRRAASLRSLAIPSPALHGLVLVVRSSVFDVSRFVGGMLVRGILNEGIRPFLRRSFRCPSLPDVRCWVLDVQCRFPAPLSSADSGRFGFGVSSFGSRGCSALRIPHSALTGFTRRFGGQLLDSQNRVTTSRDRPNRRMQHSD